MLNILLQIVDSTKPIVQAATKAATEVPHTSLFDLILKGGWLMIPIALLFFLSLYFFIERLLIINKANKIDENFMLAVKDHVANGNIQAAKSYCKGSDSPIARVIEKGVSRIGKPIKEIERSMENVAELEIYKLERFLNIIKIIAGIAPMFGFLGTIAGMMKLFEDIAADNNLSIGVIASGINIKMVTSASGLIVGIFAFICYNSLNGMIDRLVNKMENANAEFLDLLQEPTEK
jgi:biopolymer transport protein ExbB